jgi:hypothetical protein
VPFGGPNAPRNFQGVHFPQNSSKLGREWDFQLKQNYEELFNRSCDFHSNKLNWRSLAEDNQKFHRNHLVLAVIFFGENAPNEDFKPKHPVE